ncbi:MAG: hypothetical protein WDN69_11845 [Aliidongia sp.]
MSTPPVPEEYLSSLNRAGEALLQQVTAAFTEQMQRAIKSLGVRRSVGHGAGGLSRRSANTSTS